MSTSAQPAHVAVVKFEPVMQVAADLLSRLEPGRSLVLRASGEAIPNAVAVANIITNTMLKDDASVGKIRVDSESPAGMGRMVSTIEISVDRRQA